MDAGARLVEESAEGAHLEEQHDGGDAQHEQRVDGALDDHGAQCLGEGYAVVAVEHGAACELAHAGYDERDGIADEDAVDADRRSRVLTDRLEGLAPAPSAESLCQDAEGERQQHPGPVHLAGGHVNDGLPVLAAVHPVENGTSQDQWHEYLQYDIARLHRECKGNVICAKHQIYLGIS